VIAIVAQTHLVALRWALITDALEPQLLPIPRGDIVAITMIANFFAQILPNVVSDVHPHLAALTNQKGLSQRLDGSRD
jgi:hypothetical protein